MWRLAWRMLTAISVLNWFFLRRFTLAGRIVLVAAGVAAIFGLDTERSMTYQAFTLMAALLAVGWVGSLGFRPAVRVARTLPRTATAGEPFVYRISITNTLTRPLAGLVVSERFADPRPSLSEFCDSGPPPDARSVFQRMSGYGRWRWLVSLRENASARPSAPVDVPAHGVLDLSAEVMPRRRGHVRFASLTLARSDPLGLVQSCRDFDCPENVVVLPRRYRLPEIALPGARRYQHGGVALAGSVGDSEEFLGLREYRPGDPLQRVHWKSFARAGKPIVKEYQDEFFERHALVLDTFGGPACTARFEEAVSVAASFAATIDTRECLLDLMFVGEHLYCVTAGRGLAPAVRLLEALASARLSGHGAFERLARSVLAGRTAHAGAILVLLAWDEAREALVRRLRAAGVAVLAWVVVDPGAPRPVESAWLRVVEVGRVQQDLLRSRVRP